MPKTLLLADDSVTIQKVVGISFANEDVVLVTVDNGDDAIAKANETRPDIVLADVVMPGKTGYEVCEAIKANPDLAHVPVLLLTGTFEAFDEARANAAGADGHITKPFEAQALVDTVNARLAEAPSAAPTTAPVPTEDAFDFLEDAGADLASTEAQHTTLIMADNPGHSEEAFSFDPAGGTAEVAGGTAAVISRTAEVAAVEIDSSAATLAAAPVTGDDPANEHTQLVMGTDELANAETLPPVSGQALEPSEDLFETGSSNDATRVDLGVSTSLLPELETDDADFGAPLDLDAGNASGPTAVPQGIDPLADSGVDHEGVLDPEGARDYDVSSSDLSEPAAPPATPLVEFDSNENSESGGFVLVREVAAADPMEDSDPGPFAEPMAAETGLDEPIFSAPLDPEPFAPSPTDPAQPIALTDPVPTAEPVAAQDPTPVPGSSEPMAVAPDLSPLMREQLHDALEKVAWEAFGDVAERIVKDALSRVEQVAWEVIPKMAETLIQEEIRKMKGNE